MTLFFLCCLFRSGAASPGQTNGEGSLEVLATRFQVSQGLLTRSPSALTTPEMRPEGARWAAQLSSHCPSLHRAL